MAARGVPTNVDVYLYIYIGRSMHNRWLAVWTMSVKQISLPDRWLSQ
jgi:hypothetical protein